MVWIYRFIFAAPLVLSGCALGAHDTLQMQGTHCARHTVTRLVFGMNTPTGTVSDAQFNQFLAAVVTPRFPAGLTVMDAHGQWRNGNGVLERENSRVLEIAHASNAVHIQDFVAIVDSYKKWFAQESVLVMQHGANVCL
jgi:hypothetical protein